MIEYDRSTIPSSLQSLQFTHTPLACGCVHLAPCFCSGISNLPLCMDLRGVEPRSKSTHSRSFTRVAGLRPASGSLTARSILEAERGVRIIVRLYDLVSLIYERSDQLSARIALLCTPVETVTGPRKTLARLAARSQVPTLASRSIRAAISATAASCMSFASRSLRGSHSASAVLPSIPTSQEPSASQ